MSLRRVRRHLLVALAAGVGAVGLLHAAPASAGSGSLVRLWTIHYLANDGVRRPAYVVLPRWYGPHRDPPLPLVISPHGRGVDARANARLWGDLPAQGPFAVVNPDGQGRRLELYSWGFEGQIDDLARMPRILHETMPWLKIDPHRIYAVGGSMGGQEVLLLVAKDPHLLAGAAAFDSPTDMALRYEDFPEIPDGLGLQMLAGQEFGGTPATDPTAYAKRSPLDYAHAIAFSGVPLQIWWSVSDQIVVDQAANSGALYDRIKALNPSAPVTAVVGSWMHSAEMTPTTRLPRALEGLGLLPATGASTTPSGPAV
jgi:acetyl esterase/lipase